MIRRAPSTLKGRPEMGSLFVNDKTPRKTAGVAHLYELSSSPYEAFCRLRHITYREGD